MGSLKEIPSMELKILGETDIQDLDYRNTLNGPREQPEPNLVTLFFYPEAEI